MAEETAPWPKQGPADWQQVIADCGLDRHMAIVGYLKSEHGTGHGHANAIVGWTLAGNDYARRKTARLADRRLTGAGEACTVIVALRDGISGSGCPARSHAGRVVEPVRAAAPGLRTSRLASGRVRRSADRRGR